MATRTVRFQNSAGHELSARLELPVNRHAGAFAVFAHCFSCNKNLNAIRSISKALTSRGFGVMRFDFTGLGESEGDFADTNFASNVDDLIAACAYLRAEHKAPALIVGHSLGGAAALFTAARVDEIQAVATIAAPSSPDHVKHLFKQDIEEIETEGKAQVAIAGRTFTIKKQFLDDLEEHNLQSTLSALRKSLLILHSPHDEIVGIDNARSLYEGAMHPKSFVSLDGADHLLSDKADAIYAGEVIGTWAGRYIKMPDRPDMDNPKEVAVRIGSDKFTTDIKAGKHMFRADEPEDAGGNDFGPTPYGLLLASLGSCTAMTLKMYADRKEWPFEEIRVHLSHDRIYQDDCDDCEDDKSRIDKIEREIEIVGDLNEKQRDRMLQIANKCPVHKTLHNEILVESSLALS